MKFHPFAQPVNYSRRLFAVLDRLLVGEIAKTLCAVLSILVLIIVSRRFMDVLEKAIEGKVSGESIFILLGLKTLSALVTLLPPALFIATLMVLGRMYRDSEMAALSAAGVGMGRIYRSVFMLAFPLSLMAGVLALHTLPWTERQTQKILLQEERTADIRGISAGRFSEYSRGDLVFYVEQIARDGEMRNLFVQNRQDEKQSLIASAKGYIKETDMGGRFMVFEGGNRYEGMPGRADFSITDFKEYAVRIQEETDQALTSKREARSSLELWYSGLPPDKSELMRRLAIPLGLLALTLIAVPLAHLAPRSGVYGNLLTAFLLYVIYENLQRIFQSGIISGAIPAWLGFGGVYGLMGLTGLALIVKHLGLRWLLQGLRNRV